MGIHPTKLMGSQVKFILNCFSLVSSDVWVYAFMSSPVHVFVSAQVWRALPQPGTGVAGQHCTLQL